MEGECCVTRQKRLRARRATKDFKIPHDGDDNENVKKAIG